MLLGAANLTQKLMGSGDSFFLFYSHQRNSNGRNYETVGNEAPQTSLYRGSREGRTWQQYDEERCSPPPLHSKWNPEKHMLSQGKDQRQISWAFMTQVLEQKLLWLFTKTCHLPLGNRKTVFFSFVNLNGAMGLILTNAVLAEAMSAFARPKVYYRLIHASCVLPLSEWAQKVEQETLENIKGTELLLTRLRMAMFCILSSWTKLVRSERALKLWLLVAAW